MEGTAAELEPGDYINAAGYLVTVAATEPVSSLRTLIRYRGQTWAQGGSVEVSNGLPITWNRPKKVQDGT